LIGAALVVLAGCHDERGVLYRCSCTVLTDFDDASKREIEVCAPSAERASNLGRTCALEGAPAPVSGCTCQLGDRMNGCRVGECRSVTAGR
jgi:hypothetical protein